MLDIRIGYNANTMLLAVGALAANYKIYDENGIDKRGRLTAALELSEIALLEQLDSGMWMDAHNQYVYYHGIITRGLAQLVDAMPEDYPKRAELAHALYRSLNHLQRSHARTHDTTRDFGEFIIRPITPNGEKYRYDPLVTSALLEARGRLGDTVLSDDTKRLNESIAAASNGIHNWEKFSEGAYLLATGSLLRYAYPECGPFSP